jgi:hypothetical protein
VFPKALPEPVRLFLPGVGRVVSPRGSTSRAGLLPRCSWGTGVQVVHTAPGILHVHVNAVRVSFFQYAYPLIAPVPSYEGVDVASLRVFP